MELFPKYFPKETDRQPQVPQQVGMSREGLEHYVALLRQANYDIYRIIRMSTDVASCRTMLFYHLTNCEMAVESAHGKLHPLEIILIQDCIEAFRSILKPHSEKLAGFSVLKSLWHLIQEQWGGITHPLSTSFMEDIRHIFLGIAGKARLYQKTDNPLFSKPEGQEAAIVRSEELDKLGEYAVSLMQRYPSGLEPNVTERRRENRERMMQFFRATEEEWEDWHWQLKNIIKDAHTLSQLVELTPEEFQGIDLAVKNNVPFAITPYYVSLMDYESGRLNDYAVRAQVIPPLDYVQAIIEGRKKGYHAFDFMLECETSPSPGIVRRYPTIAIFKPYNACAQICVYCQRNWEVKSALEPGALLSKEDLEKGIQWFAEHPTVREVLITGGDPLVMNDRFINRLLYHFALVPHIERIRIGSRLPVVLPQRVTEDLAELIAGYQEPGKREICIVSHVEHTYEITPELMEATQKFRRYGIPVYNQMVYTLENSRRFEAAAVRHRLRLIGIMPYYTFNAKGKEETNRYRVPIARLVQEQKEEARLMSGMVRTDEAVFNIPKLGKNYLRAAQHHELISILPNGSRVYEFHPWEKKISLVDTYIIEDVPIWDYLQELERRGENPKDYESIWYYF